MSWYFDTENWAAGMWNSWAESRTDTWREAMVRAVIAERRRRDLRTFAVEPEGVGAGDFSFVVIGDPGEGDASQHVLRDQLLTVANGRRRAIRRHLVGRRVSDRLDERLRGEVLAAVQRRDPARLRHSRQPRLVRRARGVRRDVPSARRGAREHSRESRGRPAPDEHDRRSHRRPHSARPNGCGSMYGVPTGFQRAPFFEIQTDRLRARRDRHRDPEDDRRRTGRVAGGRARPRRRQVDDGHPRPSVLRRRPRHGAGDEEFARLKQLLDRSRRHDRHGGRHARSRVLRRAAAAARRPWFITSSTAAAART